MGFEDRFQLKVPLGETAHGTVWSAEDKLRKRPAAVITLEDDAPAPLLARVGALVDGGVGKVRSTVLARVVDAGRTEEGLPYIATELIEGAQSLEARLREGPPMRAEALVRLVVDVLAALAKLHEAGLFHGDIEPGNVLVLERGSQLAPRVIGLGLNRALVREGALPLESPEHLAAIGYLAPEQAAAEPASGPNADLFSAVAILYAGLSGRLPYRGADADAIRAAAAERHVPRIGKVCEALANTALGTVIDKALSRDPADRYDDVAALSSALRGALIRTRGVRELEAATGERATAPDDSDDALSAERATGPTPEPERKGLMPRVGAPPKLGAPRLGGSPIGSPSGSPAAPVALGSVGKKKLKPVTLPPPANPKPAVPPPGGRPPPIPKPDGLRFERISGLLEIPEMPEEGAPSPPAAKASDEDRLELERLSGLLEIPPDGGAPRRLGPADASRGETEASEADVELDEDGPDADRTAAAPGDAATDEAKDAEADDAEADDAEADDAEADDADDAPRMAEGAKAEDAKAEGAKAEGAKAEDAKAEDAKAEDAKAEDAKAGDAKENIATGADASADASQLETTDLETTELDADDLVTASDAPPPPKPKPKAIVPKPDSVRPGKKKRKKRKKSSRPPPPVAASREAPAKEAPAPTAAAPVATPTESETPRWVPIAVIAGLAAALVVGVWAFTRGGDEPTDPPIAEATPGPSEDPPAPEVTDPVAPPDVAPPAPSPDPIDPVEPPVEEPPPSLATIALTGVPEGAEVRVAGTAVEGTSFELGDAALDVEVVADGFETWRRTVQPGSESPIAVELTAIAPPAPDPTPTARRAARATGGATRRAGRTTRRSQSSGRASTSGRSTSSAGHPGAITDPGF